MIPDRIPDKRQTGRTHRMLEHARLLDSQGQIVFVLVNSQFDMARCQTVLEGTRIDVQLFETADLNVFTMKMRRAHPSHVVLVDHEAIRTRYFRMLQEYFAYNEVTRQVGRRKIHLTPEQAEQVNEEINAVLFKHGLLQEEENGLASTQEHHPEPCKSEHRHEDGATAGGCDQGTGQAQAVGGV